MQESMFDASNPGAIASTAASTSTGSTWFHRAAQLLQQGLMERNEIKVWCTCDRTGQTWWHIRNPRTGQVVQFDSEAAACRWIEQYHHH